MHALLLKTTPMPIHNNDRQDRIITGVKLFTGQIHYYKLKSNQHRNSVVTKLLANNSCVASQSNAHTTTDNLSHPYVIEVHYY